MYVRTAANLVRVPVLVFVSHANVNNDVSALRLFGVGASDSKSHMVYVMDV